MKNHWIFKALCIMLAMLSGAMLVIGIVGMMLSDTTGYVSRWQEGNIYETGRRVADQIGSCIAGQYAQKKSGVDKDFFQSYIYWDYSEIALEEYDYDYRLIDDKGRTLENTMRKTSDYEFFHDTTYAVPVANVTEIPKLDYYPEYEEYIDIRLNNPEELLTDLKDFPPLYPGTYSYAYAREITNGVEKVYRLDFYATDNYTVEIGMTREQLKSIGESKREVGTMPQVFARYDLRVYVGIIAGSGVALILSIVFLCAMAGKRSGTDEIRAAGLNRLPLDLYLFGAGAVFLLGLGASMGNSDAGLYLDGFEAELWLGTNAIFGMMIGVGPALFCMGVAAQIREGNHFLLRNSICGRLLHWCASSGRKLMSLAIRKLKRVWFVVEEPLRNLPMTWQWMIGFGGLWLLYLIAAMWDGVGVVLLLILAPLSAALVFYVSGAFGKLHYAARNMAKGGLDAKINTNDPWFHGCFGEFAKDLNTLGDTCMEAARKQMKSERMKSELITNVSHDIKTPLTSIINYVDLLQSAQSDQQRQEYLEVLDRQSQQLKKLIEDLMEMSKVSSGNISAEVVPTDVTEAVGQALGEFSDRLRNKNLHVVQQIPNHPLMAAADGRLLWRVLSNVLGNVVKYAMPGTRVYVDVEKCANWVQISVKNISAEILNITAEELMDRFVRGDSSRNTEGNGLGLNIAKGLMEVQHGTLELSVDGDLFKVVLTLQESATQEDFPGEAYQFGEE